MISIFLVMWLSDVVCSIRIASCILGWILLFSSFMGWLISNMEKNDKFSKLSISFIKLSVILLIIATMLPSKLTNNILLSMVVGNTIVSELKDNSLVKKGLATLEKELDKRMTEDDDNEKE